jgi:hypothetical protein
MHEYLRRDEWMRKARVTKFHDTISLKGVFCLEVFTLWWSTVYK